MGLEAVELILELESEFGIEIPDKDAEQLFTIGATQDYILRKIHRAGWNHCLSQRVFYRLRKGLMGAFGLERNQINLKMSLSELVPTINRRLAWSELSEHACLPLPALVRPGYILWPTIALSIFSAVTTGIWLNPWASIPALIIAPILFFKLTTPAATGFPPGMTTLASSVKTIQRNNYGAVSLQPTPPSDDDIFDCIKQIIVDKFGVDKDDLNKATRYYEDLNFG